MSIHEEIAVQCQNSTRYWMLWHMLLYMINKSGDKIQLWGEPVQVVVEVAICLTLTARSRASLPSSTDPPQTLTVEAGQKEAVVLYNVITCKTIKPSEFTSGFVSQYKILPRGTPGGIQPAQVINWKYTCTRGGRDTEGQVGTHLLEKVFNPKERNTISCSKISNYWNTAKFAMSVLLSWSCIALLPR